MNMIGDGKKKNQRKMIAGLLGKKSVPITVEGKVFQGRCLLCDPFPVAAAKSSPSPSTTKKVVATSATAVDDVRQRRKKSPVICHNNDSNYSKSPSSSSSSSSPRQQQQQQQPAPITADVAPLNVTRTTTAIPTKKNLQQHHQQQQQQQQQQRLETISGVPPRQQRTQTQNHRLETSDENFDNIDSRIQQEQQRQQQQQQQQQRIEHTTSNNNNINNSGMNIDARAAGPAAAKKVGVPKTLEVVHRSDRRPINNSNISGGSNGNNSDNDNIGSGGGGGNDTFNDDHSMVSAITMDIHLSQPYYEEDYIIPPQRRHRPGPERSTNNSALSANGNDFHNTTSDDIGHQINHNHHYQRPRRHPTSNSISNNNDNNRHRNESPELFRPPPPPTSSSAAAADGAVIIAREHRHDNNKDIEFRPPDDDGDDNNNNNNNNNNNDNDNDFPSFIMDDYDYNHDQNCPRQQQQQNDPTTAVVNASLSNIEHITMPQAPGLSSSSAAAGRDKDESKKEEVDDVSEIFRCLNFDECNPDNRVQALSSLDNILRSDSGDKREFISEHNVIETVSTLMWADMEIVEVQEAAMNLLFVIATCTASNINNDNDNDSGDTNNNMLSNKESVCDSILFTMQNHATVSAIQLKGCLIFASLAATSSDNKNNSDGSLSGAMIMVLNAMSNHGGSRKAGLQAIHHQCLLSAHAEDNKRRLVESKLENGISGIDVIIYAMEELQQDSAAMEWACELSWCMTSSKDLLKHFKDTSLHEHIVSICQHYMKNPIMVFLIEACVGTIANLSSLEDKRNELISLGAFELILDGLRDHGNSLGICCEATVALENFVLSSKIQDSIGKSEAVAMVVRVLNDMDSPKYTGVSFRALACMAAHSQEAKERIGTEEIINIVHESSSIYDDNSNVQEQFATLIAALAIGSEQISDLMIKHGVVDLLLDVMNRFPEERVQDAACLAFRNISTPWKRIEILCQSKPVPAVSFGTCYLRRKKKELAVNSQTVDYIIKAMQSHIESGDLLELACGALWIIVDSFDDQKVIVGNKAIDAVACAMVMHPNNTPTLENACGLLSNLSSEKSLAEAIGTVQGVSIVAEAMRNNGSSIALIETGCLTLKNITSMFPSFVQDASVAITSVINAMKENVKSTSLMKEACDLIWVLSSEEDNIRSKILALDGISILMKCLEQNSDDPEVQTSALRAFNQLATSNTQNGV
ncbi:ARM repeat-containing protein [Fragilariopsis cylindrus CCMP1102]|uniref:ARM repeat-containing protein n=1 Tax=Fragilariopsis cylindrus CCMP1102 TaxID=635003 RepID=A0A1E7FCZ1_9STRA|nr:ARM repeat-containing protein [Fragilariopsis cylindrus CCMP1102]|eukprot:OEU15683.1 ARM repeat-containing protein [Fragilariopsis cylindrus CCMP1102]